MPKLIEASKTCEQCGRVFTRQDKPGVIYHAFMRLRFCSYPCSHSAAANTADDFLKFVSCGPGCWEWSGPRNDKGYGVFHCRGIRRGAHRVSYEHFKGPIPSGLHVLHECDNPPCVNPDHLHVGTHQQNMREAKARNRFNNPGGEKHPTAKLTAAQVAFIRSNDENGAELARRFGVSKSTIYAVRKGQNWGAQQYASA